MQPKRVLIVDDEPKLVSLLLDGLAQMGDRYIFDAASDGDEALAKIRQVSYSLILTVYRMSGLNGLELTRKMRQNAPHTPIMLISAHDNAELRIEVEKLGIFHCFDRSLSVAQIREAVRQSLEHTDGAREEALLHSFESAYENSLQDRASEYLEALLFNTGARCVLLFSSSGHTVDAAGQTSDLNIGSIGVLVAASFAGASELARLLGNLSVFKSSYHEGPDYNIYSYDVNGDYLLVVVFGTETAPGLVWYYTKQTAATLASLEADDISMDGLADVLASAVDAEMDRMFGEGEGDSGNGSLWSDMQEDSAAETVTAEPENENPSQSQGDEKKRTLAYSYETPVTFDLRSASLLGLVPKDLGNDAGDT